MSNTSTTRSVTGEVEDPWGQYRSTVTDCVANCADYLGRLERSLGGEAAPDRAYFAARAVSLFEAVRDLVRLVEEVEGWLILCGATITHDDPDGAFEAVCELPLNHYGAHDDQPLPSLAVQVRDSARELMDRAGDTASWVNALGLISDKRRAFEIEKEFDPESHEIYFDLQQTAGFLISDAKEVSDLIDKLIYEVSDEEWDELNDYEDDDEVEDGDLDGEASGPQPPTPAAPRPRRARGLDL